MKSILTAVLLTSCAWAGDVTNQGHYISAEGVTNIPAGTFTARFHDGQGGVIVIPELPVTNLVQGLSGIATNELPYSIEMMRERGILTNTVKTLAEAGEVCAVYGHMFRDGRPGSRIMVYTQYGMRIYPTVRDTGHAGYARRWKRRGQVIGNKDGVCK